MLISAIPRGTHDSEPDQLLKQRRDFIARTREDNPPLLRAWQALYREVAPALELPALPAGLPEPGTFLRGSSGHTSIVKLPNSLKLRLPHAATQLILELLRDSVWQRRVERVFARSFWHTNGAFFETVASEGKACIAGSDGPLLGHVLAIAHELGHCLYDEVNGWGSTAALFESEAAAFVVEDVMVRAVLASAADDPALALKDWSHYLELQDSVTRHFCRLETAEVIAGETELSRAASPEFLSSRRSYVERVGMQWAYGFAAATRRRLRAQVARSSIAGALSFITAGRA